MPEFIVLPEPPGKKLDIDEFTRGYMECAIWLSSRWVEGEDNPLDAESGRWSIADIDEESRKRMIDDCREFQLGNVGLLAEARELGRPDSHLGHDFYLSRNSHGSGFFARGNEPVWRSLQNAAKVYGTFDLVIEGDILKQL